MRNKKVEIYTTDVHVLFQLYKVLWDSKLVEQEL